MKSKFIKKQLKQMIGHIAVTIICFFMSISLKAQSFKIGEITQSEGSSTFLHFASPHKLEEVKKKTHAQLDGSYLTQDSSFITIQFFDGSWLRASPKSKFSLEFFPKSKQLIVHLFTGSIKVLFSNQLNEKKLDTILVKSADTIFETVGAKFSVVRNALDSTNSVYVEKGSVVTTQFVATEKKDMEIVHENEMTSVRDNDHDISSPRKMSAGEMNFLHPSKYLNIKSSVISGS